MTTTLPRWIARPQRRGLVSSLAIAAALAAGIALPTRAHAEPAACLSPDPAAWPAASKPYFMVAFDTSTSMTTLIKDAMNNNVPDSCGYGANRLSHGRCALKNTIQAFGGQVNFGLASYARKVTSCPAGTCSPTLAGCNYAEFSTNVPGAACSNGCGPEPLPDPIDSATRDGANILVPMQRDNYFSPPLEASNVPELLSYVDNDCTGGKELFPNGCTPMNGMLRSMYKYFSSSWTRPDGGPTFASPLGTLAQGERPCRSVNVIFITDGFETCDQADDAADAAGDLFNGFTKDGINWKVKTFVIDFGDAAAEGDAIATAGGTGTAKDATNEAQLSAALANILTSAISPESCDNADNNCNGCTDEGFTHYCNTDQACCAWANASQRVACLTQYKSTITPADPDGDLTKLPCTTALNQTDPLSWLCFDPKETCDSKDNNCQGGVDEGVLKCGNPSHCPSAEVCDGSDNDCDGFTDEGIPGCVPCQPSPEICDGCDNDCDGIADDGIAPIPCGLATPPACLGQLICKPAQAVPPGQCVAGGGFNTCNNSPVPEICNNGVDEDCDGEIDNGAASPCDPPGGPYNYGPNSHCKQGTKPCNSDVCQGAVGPEVEVCDGIDNDCDGQVDEGALNVGQSCGLNQSPCSPGVTACVAGALVCQGGTGPQSEICDGIDNDCDGIIDDAPLADGPAAGMAGCWDNPGNCCSFGALTWCQPAGATCNGLGTLTQPCLQGVLTCQGALGWACVGPKGPSGEVCDAIDNNCNGLVDDGNLPMQGDTCGSSVGTCKPGTLMCTGGVLDCIGDTEPSPEVCNGQDDNCNNLIDDGIPAGAACVPIFDQVAYPDTPTDVALLKPPCQPGQLECQGGVFTCVGGVGPKPETCDAVDNDCDGLVDEVGAPPNGMDGTSNPYPPPNVNIGDACGVAEGQCSPGAYGCVNGKFECIGGQGPALEECDCNDNDCDGVKDNQNPPGEKPLCSPGKTCVKSGNSCQCAAPCGEVACPGAGQDCKPVTDSNDMPIGSYCVAESPCGDDNCASKIVKDALGNLICAPLGTPTAGCAKVPVCACKGQSGCQDPCFNVVCSPGLVCVRFGPNAGQCGLDNCYNQPCPGCDQACVSFQCSDNPCDPNPCPAGQACEPNATFTDHTCVGSCADVMCAGGQICVDGQCVDTCDPACPAGQFCDQGQSPPACAPSLCANELCLDGRCCDPKTGACGACPCEGKVCPAEQACVDGECVGTSGAGGGGGSSSSTSSSSGSVSSSSGGGSTSTSSSSSGGASAPVDRGTWGLPTGGGGCACEVGVGAARDGSSSEEARFSLLAFALGALGLSRRRKNERRAGKEVSR